MPDTPEQEPTKDTQPSKDDAEQQPVATEYTEPVEPDESDAAFLLTSPHDVRECGRETIYVTVELTDLERLELAATIAEALERRDALNAKLASIKKSYKTMIDAEIESASKAKDEYRAGKRIQSVSCNVFEDLRTLERVYNDSISGREVFRRKMTYDERQCKF